MLTLGIETATDTCSVALLSDDHPVVETSLHRARAHGRRLAPLVREALAHADHAPADLDLVAVSIGPGSYTGLRIGLGLAKGLALSTGAALVAVPTLDALAHAAGSIGRPLVVALPSRRGEVYAAAYDAAGQPLRPAVALRLPEAASWLPSGDLALAGPGADGLADAVPTRDVHRLGARPSGLAVARLGAVLLARRGADDPAQTEPAYLKPVATSRPRAIFGP